MQNLLAFFQSLLRTLVTFCTGMSLKWINKGLQTGGKVRIKLRRETEAVCKHRIIAAWRRGYDYMFGPFVCCN